jgi:uncharacterized protein HemX
VSESDVGRLMRDVEDFSTRLREIEVHGTEITKSRLGSVEEDVKEIKADVKTLVNSKANVSDLQNMQKTQDSARAAVRAALVAAALALGGSLILFAVQQAANKP